MVRPQYQPWVERFIRAGIVSAYSIYPARPDGGDRDRNPGWSADRDRYPAPDCDHAADVAELAAWGSDTRSTVHEPGSDLNTGPADPLSVVSERTRDPSDRVDLRVAQE